MQFVELDQHTTLRDQFGENASPLVIVNRFVVPPEDESEFVKAWQSDRDWFAQQPGFVSARLIKGLAGSHTFLNIAKWQSSEHFRAAVMQPEVREFTKKYPTSVIESLHLFRDAE
ncbi:MAG: antibiotic biosynthesis monooxygenase family protein [Casimicrobium sp.]